jgi:hypothetical protein
MRQLLIGNPLVGCFFIWAPVAVVVVWLVLLISSIVFRPKPGTGVRLLDRLLIIVSILMIAVTGLLFVAAGLKTT